MISVVSGFPPRFLCDSVDCTIEVRVQVQSSTSDLSCPELGSRSQLVLGSSAPADGTNMASMFCGHVITSDNWQTPADIAVVATLDGVRDEDEQRLVEVSGVVVGGNGTEISKQYLQNVEVSEPIYFSIN